MLGRSSGSNKAGRKRSPELTAATQRTDRGMGSGKKNTFWSGRVVAKARKRELWR
jgi:hypothetical protein